VVPVTGDIDQARAIAQAELDAVQAGVAQRLDPGRYSRRQ
jgi:hypothetical protein